MAEVKKTYEKGATKKYLILIGNEEFEAQQEQEFTSISQTAELKGFRKGHAPLSMIKKLYEAQAKEKVINKILQEQITKIVKEEDLKLATTPSVIKGDEGDLSFLVTLDLSPVLPEAFNFAQITYEVPEVEISDEEVNTEVKLVASKNKEFKTKDGVSEKGDVVVIDFKGFIDEVPFAGGEAQNHELELGSGAFIPGFEDQLIGHAKDAEIKVKVSFPAEYHAKNLAGKEAIFQTKIKEIKQGIVPEINDEFAKKLSLETVEDLKNNIKTRIESFYANAYKENLKPKIFDSIANLLDFDVAEGLVEKVAADIAKEQNTEVEKVMDEATKRLRLSFFLTDLGNKQKVEVSEQDFTNFIIQNSQDTGMNPFAMINFYNQNKDAKNKLLILLEENKIYDFIFSQITTTTKKVSKPEFDEILKNSN